MHGSSQALKCHAGYAIMNTSLKNLFLWASCTHFLNLAGIASGFIQAVMKIKNGRDFGKAAQVMRYKRIRKGVPESLLCGNHLRASQLPMLLSCCQHSPQAHVGFRA